MTTNPVAFIGEFTISGTSGSVLFVDSNTAIAQDNTNFFWDDTNNRLGIGTASPSTPLHILSAATTTDVFTIDATSLTTGSAIVINGPAVGVTDAIIKVTSNIGHTGVTNGLINLTGTVDTTGSSKSGVNLFLSTTNSPTVNSNTVYGTYNTIIDSTTLGNQVYGNYTAITLTGNANKTAYGFYFAPSTSSTTADTLEGSFVTLSVLGAISTGTRSIIGHDAQSISSVVNTGGTVNLIGFKSSMASGGANSGGTTNIYGFKSNPSSTGATTGSTTNVYGLRSDATAQLTTGGTIVMTHVSVGNATMDGTGTSTQYGAYIEALSGADTNIGIRIDLATQNTLWVNGSTDSTNEAGGIVFGTSKDTNLYRSAANTLKTDDSLTIAGGTITLSVDTNVVLSGGVNGISFGNNVLSIDDANGRVGIGTIAPTSPLHVTATNASSTAITAAAITMIQSADLSSGNAAGQVVSAIYTGVSTGSDTMIGNAVNAFYQVVSGTLTTLYGQFVTVGANVAGGTVTNAFAYYAGAATTGTVTTLWDFYGSDATAFNYFAGKVGIGSGASQPNAALSIGGSATRATTQPTNAIDIYNGTAPVGALTNGCTFYVTSGEMRVMDAGGTATLLSSHSLKTGEWIHDSHNVISHKRLIVKMEQMAKFIDERFGTNFVEETFDKEII